MKVIVTGDPKSGKSTLVWNLVRSVQPRHGFHTAEFRVRGERRGFQVVSSRGQAEFLASVNLPDTGLKVDKYFVNLGALDSTVQGLWNFRGDELLYVDEIGQMQLQSEYFKSFVMKCLDFGGAFLGTMSAVYRDDFTDAIRARRDVTFIHLTASDSDRKRVFARASSILNRLPTGR